MWSKNTQVEYRKHRLEVDQISLSAGDDMAGMEKFAIKLLYLFEGVH